MDQCPSDWIERGQYDAADFGWTVKEVEGQHAGDSQKCFFVEDVETGIQGGNDKDYQWREIV